MRGLLGATWRFAPPLICPSGIFSPLGRRGSERLDLHPINRCRMLGGQIPILHIRTDQFRIAIPRIAHPPACAGHDADGFAFNQRRLEHAIAEIECVRSRVEYALFRRGATTRLSAYDWRSIGAPPDN